MQIEQYKCEGHRSVETNEESHAVHAVSMKNEIIAFEEPRTEESHSVKNEMKVNMSSFIQNSPFFTTCEGFCFILF